MEILCTDQPDEPKREIRFIPIDLTLRTQQIDYLQRLADRDDTRLSRALGAIIEKKLLAPLAATSKPTRKVRKHFSLIDKHLAFIDRLCVIWGLPRSDVARRLIDEALAVERTPHRSL